MINFTNFNEIRKEIEGQLGIKRAEIRDRLKILNEQMDKFREMAEEKMRDQKCDFDVENEATSA